MTPSNMPSLSHSLSLTRLLAHERLFFSSLLVITGIRLAAILASPLELGVDEAQYWLWGQSLDFGYYSKPPLIGWFLFLTDSLLGSSAAATRFFAPLLHLVIALLLYHIGRAHHGDKAGKLAALFWLSLPIVSLGSFVISTDTILLVPWVLALAFFLKAQTTDKFRDYVIAGLIIGVGLLAKYAASYFILGASLSLFCFTAKDIRHKLVSLLCLIGGALVSFSPNLIWNVVNGGVTFNHIGENADLAEPSYSFVNAFEFLLSQIAVIGPVMAIILIASGLRVKHHKLMSHLLCFIVPVVIFMTIQAYLKTANANWAATAWPAACLLVAIGLADFIPRIWGRMALSVNYCAALITAFGLGMGDFYQLTPSSDPLRRMRGWQALADDVSQKATEVGAQIIIADRRAEAALLSWHLADSGLVVRVIDEDGVIGSHFELTSTLSQTDPKPYLILSETGAKLPSSIENAEGPIGTSEVTISQKRQRQKLFYLLP